MTFPRTFPVIHNITNYVSMGISANALLAVGASPLMSSAPEEMEDIASFAGAMVANLGCLESLQCEAISIAAAAYHRLGKPWVLDPAGVGIGAFRRDFALRLIDGCRPSAIRGNRSEIAVLAGKRISPEGLDARRSGATKDDGSEKCAMELAQRLGCVVVMSGKTDIITDGKEVVRVEGGCEMATEVTAMGCVSSAILSAFLAENPDVMEAAADVMALMKAAALAAGSCSRGPGSFAVSFIDALAAIRSREGALK